MKHLHLLSISLLCLWMSAGIAQTTPEKPKAYFTVSKSLIDFGELKVGATKTVNVTFTNTGDKPLIISSIYTSCGCTEVDYPREPFMPGKSGTLKISYSATEGEGFFSKIITVYTNAKNKKEDIKIEGVVIPK